MRIEKSAGKRELNSKQKWRSLKGGEKVLEISDQGALYAAISLVVFGQK